MPLATEEALQLEVFVDSASWEGQFDSLEIWRSRLSDGGPYEPLMGDASAPARLPTGVLGPPPVPPVSGPSTALSGKTLFLRVDEHIDLSIVLTGADPLSFGQAAAQITTGGLSLVTSFVIGNRLVIETTQPGSGAILRVVGGDAAPLLGLMTTEPGSVDFGRDARIPLLHNVSNYLFTDFNGKREFFYRSRFFNTLSRIASDFGRPFTGKFLSSVSPQNLVKGTIDFVDLHGNAKANQEVLIYNRFNAISVEERLLVATSPIRRLSDEDGHIEFTLVRGAKLTVAVAGTDLVRDIDVPTDPTIQVFNLLDPNFGRDDLFKVQVPNISFAVRRSL